VFTRKNVTLVVAILVAALGLTLVGCAGFTMEDLTQARQTVEDYKATAEATIIAMEANAQSLPEGSEERERAEKIIAKAREAVQIAEQSLAHYDEAIKSIEDGELDPNLAAALNSVPYGVYITTAIAGIFAFLKARKAKLIKEALTDVVISWDEVGEELTDYEKKLVRAIQGERTTAIVREIKDRLG